ncbi:ImmA/IrrE family metallo-endopeptidase [Methylomicrobium sp. Wu6]|uniref:ImmA/IrrE family metallo-endopeptidase n=1 Tax=Methylomicrobium sp. Wu6 TaxID=3107928 RepID=UPI002DD6A0B4|nr:ImmA/IrrE family metallo-endopeptidase [Methylomicrobium sp. Wu6]MEC4747229.1 ImmA/IrrE family metallo-endopeptidase [Methylomicrobium sp. Wu6]
MLNSYSYNNVDDSQARSLISELLHESRLYRSGQDYQEMLDFVVRLRNFAPFNAFLLHTQKPGLRFAAFASDWRRRFERTVKEGARPLVIMWPFSPVAWVYDVEDTDGPDLPRDIAEAFRATGPIDQYSIKWFIQSLAKHGIETLQGEYGDGLAGFICKPDSVTTEIVKRVEKTKEPKADKEKSHYRIRLNQAHSPSLRFATLTHELAHLFLGHLGYDGYLKITDRRNIAHELREIEAESVCYIVCRRNGVEPDSWRYLANFRQCEELLARLDYYPLLKAAGRIETVLELATHSRF